MSAQLAWQLIRAHLGLQHNVRVTSVELALVAAVGGRLLDHLERLDTPDLQAKLLADTLVAGVENGGETGGGGRSSRGLQSCGATR